MSLPPARVYEFIKLRLKSGQAPTLQEIGDYFDRSPSTVYNVLLRLENQGLIERTRKWRGIQIVEKS